MQKKIIALAVAGLVSGGAFAQSNVTVSGNIGVSYNQYSLSGAANGRSTWKQNMVSDESSAIILNGEEDLGGGMKAWFQIDSRLTMDRGRASVGATSAGYPTSGLGDGNTAVGVKGNFGTFGVGRWDLHYDAFAPVESYTAGALAARVGYFGIMAQINGGQVALGTRASNVMFYDSPNMNGFKARIAYSTSAATGEGGATYNLTNGDPTSGSAYNIKLNYDNGPINAVYSYWNHKEEGRGLFTNAFALATCTAQQVAPCVSNTPAANAAPAPVDQKSSRLGFAYTFPMGLKLGLAWDRSTAVNGAGAGLDATRTAWMLPIKYSTGNHDIQLTYAQAGNTSNVAGDSSAKEWVAAYGYRLSKRTSVGIQYVTVTNKGTTGAYSMGGLSIANTGNTNPVAGEDSKLLTFNMRHFF